MCGGVDLILLLVPQKLYQFFKEIQCSGVIQSIA